MVNVQEHLSNHLIKQQQEVDSWSICKYVSKVFRHQFYYSTEMNIRIKSLTLASITFFGNLNDLENHVQDVV